jgi:predicted alpha/beta hydrolase
LFGYFPARRLGLGEDLPREVARRWAFWGRCPHYVIGRLDAASQSGYRQWHGRLRALTAEDDTFANETSVRAFIDFFPAARTEFGLLRPRDYGLSSIGHFGYFRGAAEERLWPSWVAWLLTND